MAYKPMFRSLAYYCADNPPVPLFPGSGLRSPLAVGALAAPVAGFLRPGHRNGIKRR